MAAILSAKANDNMMAIQDLVRRILPAQADNFQFALEDGEQDFFRLGRKDNKILIAGNNANSMAMGLNYYLKKYCKTTVSWYDDTPVATPSCLPRPDMEERKEAAVPQRFFLNYCTFGYSMPFWKWKQWERFIDWMALNGINMPLATTGQEAVWQKVWSSFGMTDEQIRSYFTGPVYLPWHRMANIDGWLGPLPQQWIDAQAILQKKILARERQLNMHPVLPAFSGHVPGQMKTLFPKAHIEHLGKWAGFTDEYRCYFLHPDDQLFGKIQHRFLMEQQKLFGTDHIYGIDPFNEVDPPQWDPDYLSEVSKGMYMTLADADPQAEWLQMTWMFYHDKKKWTSPRIKALLTAVPNGKMALLDYHCENVELWRQTNRFHGQPFIWCYLGNFGGNTALAGNVEESGRKLDEALKHGGENLRGIGSTLEGLDVQQFPYEYIFEKAWGMADTEQWIDRLADSHSGKCDVHVRRAWHILIDSIYIQVPRTLGILPTYRPIIDGKNKRTDTAYHPKTLERAWLELLKADGCETTALAIDLITVGRQLLGNDFLRLKEQFDKKLHEKDEQGMRLCTDRMLDILDDIDLLCSYNPHCRLDTWIDLARDYDPTGQLSDYYEQNARTLVTTWGGSLNDYAARAWAGLIGHYYKKRWRIYIEAAFQSIKDKTNFDQAQVDKHIRNLELEWAKSSEKTSSKKPGTDLLALVQQIHVKRMKYQQQE